MAAGRRRYTPIVANRRVQGQAAVSILSAPARPGVAVRIRALGAVGRAVAMTSNTGVPRHDRHERSRLRRLRPLAPAPALAGRCPARAEPRPQLRGGRRALDPERRCHLRELHPRDLRHRGARGPAGPQHREPLRLRCARRRLANPAAVRGAGRDGDHFRRGPGACAESGSRPVLRRAGLRGREPQLALVRLCQRARGSGTRAHPEVEGDDPRADGRGAGRLLLRPGERELTPARDRVRRPALRFGRL